MLRVPAGEGPGAHRLGLQRLLRPAAAHLMGQDALHVVLQIHHVDDIDVSAGDPVVLETAVVLVALEPGDGVHPPVGQDAQALRALAVELKQHLRGLGDGDHHAGGAAGHHLAGDVQFIQRVLRVALRRPTADPHHEVPGDVGGIAAVVLRRRVLRLLVIVKDIVQLDVILSDDALAAGGTRGIGAVAADGDVSRRRHGDGGLPGAAQILKLPVTIEPAELVALAFLVQQIGRIQRTGAVFQAHFDGVFLRRRGIDGTAEEKCHNKQHRYQVLFHAASQIVFLDEIPEMC